MVKWKLLYLLKKDSVLRVLFIKRIIFEKKESATQVVYYTCRTLHVLTNAYKTNVGQQLIDFLIGRDA